jgi:hypothetical protein
MKDKNKNKIVIAAGLSALALASLASAIMFKTSDNMVSAETSANLYPSIGFEDILSDRETSYDFAGGARKGVGQVGASVKAIKETTTGGSNTYLQLSNGGGSDSFANTFALFSPKLSVAGTYTISFDFRKEAGFTTTDNVGFRLWTDAATMKDGEALATKINAEDNEKWFTISTTYELSEEQASVKSDSIQLWFNTKEGTNLNVLDVDNITITHIVNLGENFYPDETFEDMVDDGETSYDFASGVKNRVGQAGASVKAIKETTTSGSNTYLQLSNGGGSDSFANTFALWPVHLNEAKKYNISFDFRKEAGFTTTDNVGFRFWTDGATLKDGEALASKINAEDNEKWFTITTTYELSAEQATVTSDSMQIWFNTKEGTNLNILDIDNIKVCAVTATSDAPVVTGSSSAAFHKDDEKDVTFTLDAKGYDITGVKEGEDNALTATDYTYDASGKAFTLKKDYLGALDAGSHTFTITTSKGEVSVFVTVYAAKGVIPSSTDGYTLTPTLLGGTFESYDVGLTFSSDQTPEAWGSLDSYDDPGVIVDDGTGNHALQLKRKTGSTKMYSSAFCMTSPDIEKGDIVTLKFDYKMNTSDPSKITGKDDNVCFVGGSNVGYHLVKLDGSKNALSVEDNSDETSWDVTYSNSTTFIGYTHVEMSFITDFAFMNSTNSLRFLMQIADDNDALLIDNVELIKWKTAEADENPTISPTTANFDYLNQQDVSFTVDLKEYTISSIKLDSKTVSSKNYTLDGTTLKISKDYLATLENGDHVFTLNTLGGSTNFTINVANHSAAPAASASLPTWAIVLIVVGSVLVVGGLGYLAFVLLKKKKAKKQ